MIVSEQLISLGQRRQSAITRAMGNLLSEAQSSYRRRAPVKSSEAAGRVDSTFRRKSSYFVRELPNPRRSGGGERGNQIRPRSGRGGESPPACGVALDSSARARQLTS
jgi:hypothetical protein